MPQRLIEVRVRPARVAVLVGKQAGNRDLLLAFEYLGRLWGGRHSQVFAVHPDQSDELTELRLENSRPEFVCGVGLDHKLWAEVSRNTCQPRAYRSLEPQTLQEIEQSHPEDFILTRHALVHLIRTRAALSAVPKKLRVVNVDESSVWALYCAAMFGRHYKDLSPNYYDELTTFSENTPEAFVDLSVEFVKNCQQSWLDVTAHELNLQHLQWGHPLAPTIVLVGEVVEDLPLFWNLRAYSETLPPAWIIPVPIEAVDQPALPQKLKDWLLEFLPYGTKPNYCQVTSQTIPDERCKRFAADLQRRLLDRQSSSWITNHHETTSPQ